MAASGSTQTPPPRGVTWTEPLPVPMRKTTKRCRVDALDGHDVKRLQSAFLAACDDDDARPRHITRSTPLHGVVSPSRSPNQPPKRFARAPTPIPSKRFASASSGFVPVLPKKRALLGDGAVAPSTP
eukprot:CAMPEP_0197422228 /NCGR_PEP_ID=MMETSP1170-20131217/14388_1 /TAXON_ID=54406 /ORGANISM="Sarcinochrysis sp, Strain CCMP770" /LENGTH=126 /DNA_ID=CAMNT_0042949555 /DNA_START=121 /DNA_END=501 /DNA_ORIENTATION=-